MSSQEHSGNVAPEGAEGKAAADETAKELAERLLEKAKAEGVDFVGSGGCSGSF